MSNLTDTSKLIHVAQLYTTYSTFIIFGFGFIGTFLNILVFKNLKIFRHNRCAFYIIAESIVDCLQLIHMFTNEIWKPSINGVDPTTVSSIWCKLRTSIAQWSRLMLSLIVCFAAIDQFFNTNLRIYLRRFSSLIVAKREIYVASLVCFLHTIPFLVYQKIRPVSGCIITNTALTNYYTSFYYPILNGVIPILVSSLFSIVAYKNVRQLIQQQIPINRRRLDQQLTAMIFVRVMTYVILSLPYTIYRIYFLSTRINPTDQYRYALNELINTVVSSLIYFNHGANFYIFFTTSSRYRRQVKYFLRKILWRSMKRHFQMCHNIIQPLNRASNANDS